MTKPYYDPKTKETYLKYSWGDYSVKMITGSVELIKHPTDKLKGIKIEKNQFGEITKKTEFNSHYVCFGVCKCIECGRELK